MPDVQPNSSTTQNNPAERIAGALAKFLHIEAAGGVGLLICTAIALVLANSSASEAYLQFWLTEIKIDVGNFSFHHSLRHLVNDGLMALFFFVIGLEVKREMVLGELRDFRRAALPIAAAIGGMVVPAGLYLALQYGKPGESGWGIPMATDIAFVVGCMAILGSRVPHSLRVMVLSLAIADDIGAILVIAVGYTDDLSWQWLATGGVGIAFIWLLARIGVRRFSIYVCVGTFVWFAFHESGVHATIAGVIIGLMTPAKPHVGQGPFSDMLGRAKQLFDTGSWSTATHRTEKVRTFQRLTRETISPLEYLENTLHPWVGFVIMPVFALANAGVPISLADVGDSVAIAVAVGLVVGKPLGIVLVSWIAVKTKIASLPEGIGWGSVTAAGFLAGIGFTMALFIAGLAVSEDLLDVAKIGILVGSALSAIIGMTLLLVLLPRPDVRVKDS